MVDTFPFFESNNLIGIFTFAAFTTVWKDTLLCLCFRASKLFLFTLNSRNISNKNDQYIFFPFRFVLYCASSPICYTMYLYIYIADRYAPWFPNFCILFLDICRASWVREEPGYLSRCTYRIQALHLKNHSPIPGRTRNFFYYTVQPSSGPHPDSHSVAARDFSPCSNAAQD